VRSKLYKQGIVQALKGHADFKAALVHDAAVNRDLIKTIGAQID